MFFRHKLCIYHLITNTAHVPSMVLDASTDNSLSLRGTQSPALYLLGSDEYTWQFVLWGSDEQQGTDHIISKLSHTNLTFKAHNYKILYAVLDSP